MTSQTQAAFAAPQAPAAKQMLKLSEVMNRTGLSRSTIYLYLSRGEFPQQVPLTTRRVGWQAAEIDAWLDERISQRDDLNGNSI